MTDPRLAPAPVVARFAGSLGAVVDLVAFYAGGSLGTGDYRPGISDLDLAAVVESAPDPATEAALTRLAPGAGRGGRLGRQAALLLPPARPAGRPRRGAAQLGPRRALPPAVQRGRAGRAAPARHHRARAGAGQPVSPGRRRRPAGRRPGRADRLLGRGGRQAAPVDPGRLRGSRPAHRGPGRGHADRGPDAHQGRGADPAGPVRRAAGAGRGDDPTPGRRGRAS